VGVLKDYYTKVEWEVDEDSENVLELGEVLCGAEGPSF